MAKVVRSGAGRVGEAAPARRSRATAAPARAGRAGSDVDQPVEGAARKAKAKPAAGRGRANEASLEAYQRKRDFDASPEPAGGVPASQAFRFVVQKHDARRLHYDLRLELDGVLKSWAVTRGPSLVPGEKRLAVHTEDHPIEYLAFEGVIPKGEYGGGSMIVWDQGRWQPDGDPHLNYRKGHLAFSLDGRRLKGRWHLVRTRPKPREKKEQWLLFKARDEAAREPGDPDILVEEQTSILSGLTNDELAARGEVREDHQGRHEAKRDRPRAVPDAARIPGARRGILPAFVEPCLATLRAKVPAGPDWLYEIKYDGYRLQARIEGGKVSMLTRSGLDWTAKFGSLAEALRDLKLGSALVDGEVVVEDAAGVSSFSALQAELSAERSGRMLFHAFDLLYLDGSDLREAPLVARKTLLAALLDDAPAGGRIRFSDHLESDGEAMVSHACRLGLEGVIAKRRDAPYRSGRNETWLKIKCTARQEFVVAGYTPSTAQKRAVGSLVLGVYEDGRLVHVGRTGTGFSAEAARALWADLETMRRDTPPFPDRLPAEARRDVRWVEPRLVCEVEFRGWTADNVLRHAAFKGLRADKSPEEVVREAAGEAAPEKPKRRSPAFRLTHPDRVLWPDVGLTKQGLAEFYEEVAGRILPEIAGRPLSLVRCPEGIGKSCFYQKHAWGGMDGSAIQVVDIGDDTALVIRDLKGLMALVQASALEIHPWGSTMEHLEQPDRMILDLDPDEGLGWEAVVAAAEEVRDRLAAEGLESFSKTTGGKGIHVVVPLVPRADWDEVKAWAQGFATRLARDAPERFTPNMAKRARTGRIFLDYLRNGRGATAVGAYSTRARAGAPVATPVAWAELRALRTGGAFRVDNLLNRLDHLAADPWAGMADAARPLPEAAKPAGRRKRR